MIAVIFEVVPGHGKLNEYLDIASGLAHELKKIDGFISVERFQSMTDPGKFLSLSIWRDEECIAQWRNTELHRNAQSEGRNLIFRDYRLRVANIIRDYGMHDREQAPADSKKIHN